MCLGQDRLAHERASGKLVEDCSGPVVVFIPWTKPSHERPGVHDHLTQSQIKRVARNLNKLAKSEKTIRWNGAVQGLRG